MQMLKYDQMSHLGQGGTQIKETSSELKHGRK